MLIFTTIAGFALTMADQSARQRISFRDYPQSALRAEKSAAAFVEILIDPEGKVMSCVKLQSFEDEQLASQICAIEKRRRWQPATMSDGSAAYALVRRLEKFWLPATRAGDVIARLVEKPDIEFMVTQLPSGQRSAEVKIVVAVDEGGAVVDCAPAAETKAPVLADLACKNRAQLPADIVLDIQGQAVPYVTALKIGFVVDEPNASSKP